MHFITLLPCLGFGDAWFYLPSPAPVIVDLLRLGRLYLEHKESWVQPDAGVGTAAMLGHANL